MYQPGTERQSVPITVTFAGEDGVGEKGIKNMLQRKILIVEDNELNRALLGNILEEN